MLSPYTFSTSSQMAIPNLLKAWEVHNRAVLQSQRMLMARQMISCHSFRGQNMTWPAATRILTLAASFNEWPSKAGFTENCSSWSSGRCDCQLGSRSRRSTSKDDEGDKAQWGTHRTVAARYPVDDRGCGMHSFLFLSVHSLVSSY